MTKEKVIDILKGIKDGTAWLMPNIAEDGEKAIDIAIKAVEHPESHWIPVTERLPKDNRQVLVYARSVHYALAKYDEMRNADGTYKKQWVTFDAWKPLYTIKEVIAWMPLPEHYRGGQRND